MKSKNIRGPAPCGCGQRSCYPVSQAGQDVSTTSQINGKEEHIADLQDVLESCLENTLASVWFSWLGGKEFGTRIESRNLVSRSQQ